jgi:small GTP-binding protein
MSTPKPKLKLKVIMLGKTTVGKTSIAIRLTNGRHNEQVSATVGASFIMADRGNIKYDIWDTGGQERFRCLMPMYIRDSRIVIFVFDVTDLTTLDILDNYTSDLSGLKNSYIIIIGNKMDLLDDEQLQSVVNIIKDKLELLTLKDKVYDCVLVSAKTGENFDNFLQKLHSCAKECKHNDKESSKNTKIVQIEEVKNVQLTKIDQTDDSQCIC